MSLVEFRWLHAEKQSLCRSSLNVLKAIFHPIKMMFEEKETFYEFIGIDYCQLSEETTLP